MTFLFNKKKIIIATIIVVCLLIGLGVGVYFYISSSSSPTCISNPGNFCSNGKVEECPLGSYCPDSNMTEPTYCPEGYYCPTPTTAIICPTGYFCPDVDNCSAIINVPFPGITTSTITTPNRELYWTFTNNNFVTPIQTPDINFIDSGSLTGIDISGSVNKITVGASTFSGSNYSNLAPTYKLSLFINGVDSGSSLNVSTSGVGFTPTSAGIPGFTNASINIPLTTLNFATPINLPANSKFTLVNTTASPHNTSSISLGPLTITTRTRNALTPTRPL